MPTTGYYRYVGAVAPRRKGMPIWRKHVGRFEIDLVVVEPSLVVHGIEVKSCGHLSLDELSEEWLMLPNVRAYSFNIMIDIPIYFLPMSINLEGNIAYFRAICHKALAHKLKLRLTLRRLLRTNYIPIENYRLTFPTPNEELGEVIIRQPLQFSLNRDDEIYWAVASKLGTITEERRKVEALLRKEVLSGDFPKLINQFVALDKLEELLRGSKQVGGEIRRADLSFQRIIVWLLSMLGFQLVELEGTAYKTIKEEDETEREADLLIHDPQTKNNVCC